MIAAASVRAVRFRKVFHEDRNLSILHLGAVLDHGCDDVLPVFFLIKSFELLDLFQRVACRARGIENLLSFRFLLLALIGLCHAESDSCAKDGHEQPH
jgi:hypothetical protein